MLITLGWGHCSKVFAISIHFNVLADKLNKMRLLDRKSSLKVLLFPLMLQTRWDNKDSLIVVIDCSREMFEKTRGEIPFQLCIKVHNNSLLGFFFYFFFNFLWMITVYSPINEKQQKSANRYHYFLLLISKVLLPLMLWVNNRELDWGPVFFLSSQTFCPFGWRIGAEKIVTGVSHVAGGQCILQTNNCLSQRY